MKLTKTLAIVLCLVMALSLLAGCSSRDDNSSSSMDMNSSSALPSEPEMPSQPEMSSAVESAKPTMSTDFSQIGTLDTTLKGWGPGRNVDADNRPSGATSAQNAYGSYDADFIAPNGEKIYLTFDEGYENGYTAKILDVLKDKQVPAVFFVTYDYVKRNPDLINRMIAEGHIVGNHSWSHPSLPGLSLEEAKGEIEKLHTYMEETFDYTMSLFRYPMGEFNEQTLAMIQQMGYRSVFWSFAYKDWVVDEQPDQTESYNLIMKYCHGGEIFLLHAVSSTNTAILPKVIDDIRAKGYVFSSYDIGLETK